MRRPPTFFKKKPQPGLPISLAGLADGLAAMERALSRMRVHDGHVEWTAGIPTIVPNEYADGDDAPYWYHTGIGTHPKQFWNSDSTAAAAADGAIAATAGGIYAHAGIYAAQNGATAAGVFLDEDATNDTYGELSNGDYAAELYDGYISDLDYNHVVRLADLTGGNAGYFEKIDGFVTRVVTATEALKATDEKFAVPNGFIAKLATTDEAGYFEDGGLYVELANNDQSIYAYDGGGTYSVKIVTVSGAGLFEDLNNSLTALLCDGTYAVNATGGVNSDGYSAAGVPGIDWPTAAHLSFGSHGDIWDEGLLVADPEALIQDIIELWLDGGNWHDDHGELTGLADNDHTQYWTNTDFGGGEDQWDGQNFADSGIFNVELRVPMISDSTGVNQIDVDNGVLLLGDGSTPSMSWVSAYANDSGGNLSADFANRQLVNAAGSVTLDWNNTNVRIPADNVAVVFGAGQDASMYYDGTDMALVTDNVAASDFVLDCGTNKTLELAETVWEDIQFPISAGKAPTSNLPTWAALTTNTGEWGFGVDEYIDLSSNELMHAWKEGTSGNFHIHVSIPSANSTGTSRYAKWTLYIAYVNASSIWTETSLTQELEIPDGSSALENFYLDMGDVSFAGLSIGTQVKCRIKRITATGGTEYGSDVFVHQCGCHVEIDTMGSRQEGTK